LEEKLEITKKYLIPKRLIETGLQSEDIRFSDEALKEIIEGYTAEAGIRRLDRSIETILRKIVRRKLEGELFMRVITLESVRMYLGQPKITHSKTPAKDETGIAYGLAVSQVNSYVTAIEAVLHAGKGLFKFTGNVGKVMRESAEAALSFIKSRAAVFNISNDFFENKDVHIHAPEGAVSKDGPSAGVAIATALTSAVLGIPVRHDVAMTGEINLRGQVLAIGGVCEKIMAAHREGKTTVILPRSNDKDFDDVPSTVLQSIRIVLVDSLDDVLKEALTEDPYINSVSLLNNLK
jgi:ATP-dependent Lon protease